ncbi:MAG: mannose-6-phosphate isomerase, class I [Jatrophihabitans sp.]|uniref:mannose-6-phosphate isomerase, class I n=1 Tax=Jatrophihabitans sp. TaxID=1932789 RepID=UPI003F7DFB5B
MPDAVLLEGARRDYAWGSTTAIQHLLGEAPDGRRLAEIWFGTHPDGATAIAGSGRTLQQWVEADPIATLGARVHGRHADLPFLVKLLAADRALSIQVHPTRAQAEAGFDREDAAGLPRDAAHRNYRDRNHKPELLYAVSDFEALCGFRPVAATQQLLRALDVPGLLPIADLLDGPDGLRAAFTHLLTLDDPAPLVDEVVRAAARVEPSPPLDGALRAVRQTGADDPGDPGVLVTLLLNHLTLRPGEAIFLGAGNVHAYLRGLGVEVMATSDNVLRAGLTPKHVDVDELLAITDFTPLAEPRWPVTDPPDTFAVPVDDFAVRAVRPDGARTRVEPHGPAVVVCTHGAVQVDGLPLGRGAVAFVPDRAALELTGSGQAVVATTGRSATA